MVYSNSEELIRYKTELESKKTPPEELVREYFELCCLKSLNLTKMK
jgi:hypothetical protein